MSLVSGALQYMFNVLSHLQVLCTAVSLERLLLKGVGSPPQRHTRTAMRGQHATICIHHQAPNTWCQPASLPLKLVWLHAGGI